jgi:hypothetical protein
MCVTTTIAGSVQGAVQLPAVAAATATFENSQDST